MSAGWTLHDCIPYRAANGDDRHVMDGVSVVIPAFNEEAAVADVVTQFTCELEATGVPYEILVVDDGSTDRTAEEASDAGARVLGTPQNLGYGLSLRRGIMAARYDHVMICDADGTYPPTAVGELVRLAPRLDMVIAARTGPNFRGRGPRAFARSGLRLFASFAVGRHVPDVNSGYRIFRKAECLRYFGMLSPGFSFTTGLTLAMISDARAVAFVPVAYASRIGQSKVRVFRDSMRMAQVLVQAMVRHNPIKIFLAITVLIWLLGLCALGAWLIFGSSASGLVAVAALLVGVQVFSFGLLAEAVRGRDSDV